MTQDARFIRLIQEFQLRDTTTSSDPEALVTGGYWHHQRRTQLHSASRDVAFQDALLKRLEQITGVVLPVG